MNKIKKQEVSLSKKPTEVGIEEESSKSSFSIVGIGASAGGLEAATALLQHLPHNTGMAFVLVQHLSPTHKSMLSDILAKKSTMPVTEATNGLEVVPNHVYVIPPNTCMNVLNGFLHLQQRKSDSQEQNLPIDFFLCSLAEYQKDKAIAVILSGTASDGSLGIKVIKGYGGITFAQDKTAKFDQMPRNAIATGSVDFVISPEGIAKELTNLSRHPYSNDARIDEIIPEADNLKQILTLLRKVSGIDFTNYKVTTLKRRILRRMMLNKIDTLENYAGYLADHTKEVQILANEIFINVTRFFRDPETFDALSHDVFSPLIKTHSINEPIRIWTTGCSTGEEAYSLAINLIELMERENKTIPVQIFATDIMTPSIEHARLGIYSENIANDVSPERLSKFFRKIDKGYQINKSVREMCIFAKQNVTADPPFSKIDLISCRNLLIYLDHSAQKRIIPIFHYALNPDGFLVLGQSENAAAFSRLFNVVNKKAKIYSKNSVEKTPLLILSRTPILEIPILPQSVPKSGLSSITDIQKEADRIILKTVRHSGVVVNEVLDIVQFRGDVSRYLNHLPGTASMSLSKWAQGGLYIELRKTIQKAIEINAPVKIHNFWIKHDEAPIDVAINVTPFKVPPKGQRYFLIVFEEPDTLDSKQIENVGEDAKISLSDNVWAEELETTRRYMQGIIDDKESTNEELQAANEEILSTNEEMQSLNEEFQSANEELESAKEELQATNEEIVTLNDELQNRNQQLTQLNDEQVNLIESISLPLIMLGRDFKIRRFTPSAASVLRLIQNDIGRPLGDVKSDIELQELDTAMHEVMSAGNLKEFELQSMKARWYKIQIRPYITSEHKIDGVVIVFLDITRLKMHGIYRDSIIQTIREPLLILNAALKVKLANKSFYETFRVKPEDTVGQFIYSLGKGQWNIPTFREMLKNVIPQKSSISDYEVTNDFPEIGHKIMLVNARQILEEDEGEDSILVAIEDITERKQAEKAQKKLTEDLTHLNKELEQFTSIASHDLQAPLRKIMSYTALLATDTDNKEHYFQRLTKAVMRMKKLIEALLDFSRADKKPEFKTINLKDLVSKLVEDMEDKHAQIIIGELPNLQGDEVLLRQLFHNLIENAVKYGKKGEISKISITSNTDAYHEIRVKDNGIGFDVKYLDKIFQPLHRLHSSDEYQGNGIGLATCEKIVRYHRGSITANSKVGKGSTFIITLPIN